LGLVAELPQRYGTEVRARLSERTAS